MGTAERRYHLLLRLLEQYIGRHTLDLNLLCGGPLLDA
jgi:hypothetical protein